MGRRRHLLRLLVPASLLALLLVLAGLQYRWTGQISEAESERMRVSLDSSVRRFAEDFDDEIGRIARSFRVPAADREALSRAAREFRQEAPYPNIVRAFYLVREGERGKLVWDRLDGDGARSAEAFPSLEAALTARLERHHPGASRLGHPPPTPLVWDDPTAVALPVLERGRRHARQPAAYVVALLDREGIAGAFFSEAVERYFGTESGLLYDVAVLDEARRAIYASEGADVDALVANADASARLFSLRRVLVRGDGRFENQRERAFPPDPSRRARLAVAPLLAAGRELARARWRVFVRHREGSLEAAVDRARFRNLALSFTVLGLLGASVVLVSLSGRRAAELGARKMEFVAGVSHELRTPLAVIRSAGQNLAHGSVSETEQVRRYGELIESHGRRLNDLVDQVLALAGAESARRPLARTVVAASRIVEGALQDCAPVLAETGAGVRTALGDGLFVVGDEESLRRAVVNLVANAAKHGGAGVAIEVSATKRDPDRVVLSVRDSGVGLADEDRGRLFEAFYRGRGARERQTPGSGLGLSLVDQIVLEHGGRVEVSSAPGEGATFRIVLPESASQP